MPTFGGVTGRVYYKAWRVPAPRAAAVVFLHGFGEHSGLYHRLGNALSCSAWSFVGAAVHDRFTRDLSRDLADGTWDDRHGHLRTLPAFYGSLILVTSQR